MSDLRLPSFLGLKGKPKGTPKSILEGALKKRHMGVSQNGGPPVGGF